MSLSKRNVHIVDMYEDLQTALDAYRKKVVENTGNKKDKDGTEIKIKKKIK